MNNERLEEEALKKRKGDSTEGVHAKKKARASRRSAAQKKREAKQKEAQLKEEREQSERLAREIQAQERRFFPPGADRLLCSIIVTTATANVQPCLQTHHVLAAALHHLHIHCVLFDKPVDEMLNDQVINSLVVLVDEYLEAPQTINNFRAIICNSLETLCVALKSKKGAAQVHKAGVERPFLETKTLDLKHFMQPFLQLLLPLIQFTNPAQWCPLLADKLFAYLLDIIQDGRKDEFHELALEATDHIDLRSFIAEQVKSLLCAFLRETEDSRLEILLVILAKLKILVGPSSVILSGLVTNELASLPVQQKLRLICREGEFKNQMFADALVTSTKPWVVVELSSYRCKEHVQREIHNLNPFRTGIIPADVVIHVAGFLLHAADLLGLALTQKRFCAILLENIKDPKHRLAPAVLLFAKKSLRYQSGRTSIIEVSHGILSFMPGPATNQRLES